MKLAHKTLDNASVLLTIISKMEATQSEPTPTAVKFTNDERAIVRAKSDELARIFGMRRIPLGTFIRWAALNVSVQKEAITPLATTETQMAQPA